MTVERRSPLLQRAVETDGSGNVVIVGVTTTTAAPGAGGAGALPATPAGYMLVLVNGAVRKVPFY